MEKGGQPHLWPGSKLEKGARHACGSPKKNRLAVGNTCIPENYANGAFLSGDGDLTEDLEYTFYGLLALGVLVN
ncbi:MAG: hypothetical protein WC384_20280 [Prolixibacteraceae bacterium]|jgi:hypothetical protein